MGSAVWDNTKVNDDEHRRKIDNEVKERYPSSDEEISDIEEISIELQEGVIPPNEEDDYIENENYASYEDRYQMESNSFIASN